MIGLLHQLTYNFLFLLCTRVHKHVGKFHVVYGYKVEGLLSECLTLGLVCFIRQISSSVQSLKDIFCKEPRIFLVNVKIDCRLR